MTFVNVEANEPDEIAETKNENGDTGELHGARQISVESHDVVSEHRCEGQRTRSLHECDEAG